MGAINEARERDLAMKQQAEAEKQRVEAEKIGIPRPPAEVKVKNNKTFGQIKNDPPMSARFLRFLEKNHKTELQESLLLAEENPDRLNRQTLQNLTEEKEKFLITMERTDTVLKTLDAKAIAKLAETSPGLKNVLELDGPQRIQEALQHKLADVAIQTPDQFEAIAQSIEKGATEEKDREAREVAIRDGFKKWGITDTSEIGKVLNGEELTGLIQKLATDRANDKFEKETHKLSWRRLFQSPSKESIKDFAAEVSIEIRNFANASNADLDRYKKNINDAMGDLAFALEATLTQNKEVHDAVIAGVYGKSIEDAETIPMKDASQALKVDTVDAEAKWKERMNGVREKNKDAFLKRKYKDWSQEQENAAWQQQFRDAAEQLVRREGGDITEERINEKTAEIIEGYNTERSPEEQHRLYQEFLKGYVTPIPTKELNQQWEANVPEIPNDEQTALANDFMDEYTENHMAKYTKGKKKGYISTAMSGFFKGLLRDLFATSRSAS